MAGSCCNAAAPDLHPSCLLPTCLLVLSGVFSCTFGVLHMRVCCKQHALQTLLLTLLLLSGRGLSESEIALCGWTDAADFVCLSLQR
jgi:hypothetical protein